jgi:hypothetical protein
MELAFPKSIGERYSMYFNAFITRINIPAPASVLLP